jgi:hypothetical protein
LGDVTEEGKSGLGDMRMHEPYATQTLAQCSGEAVPAERDYRKIC